jgi:hypothetical protein
MASLRRYALLWAVAFVACPGCRKQAPPAVFTQPPAAVAPQPRIAPAAIPDPPKPESSGVRKPVDPPLQSEPMQVPPPPAEPKKAARRRAKPQPPAPVAPVAATPAPAAEEIESTDKTDKTPHLGILLSADEQQRLNSEIDQDLKQANGLLVTISAKRLTPAQQDIVAQIRSFVEQTEILRKTDLQSAGGIARKAAVLAADLDARLR